MIVTSILSFNSEPIFCEFLENTNNRNIIFCVIRYIGQTKMYRLLGLFAISVTWMNLAVQIIREGERNDLTFIIIVYRNT